MPHVPRSRTWLLLAATIVLQISVFRTAKVLRHDIGYGKTDFNAAGGRGLELLKRNMSIGGVGGTSASSLNPPYLDWYLSTPDLIPRILLACSFLAILAFLFFFIGITASDFFCPNLATIAAYLGLSESTAGVTFLAFGNGSPDVFSTFSALREGTFGLAVGELIGAATFIVSIVIGSIALIRPFHVPRHAFIRDLLFFLAAVLLLVYVLHDGHLTLFESGGMVILYLLYVIVVVAGNWLAHRRRKHHSPSDGDWKSAQSSGRVDGYESQDHGERDPFPPLDLPPPHIDTQQGDQEGSTVGSLTPAASPLRPRLRPRASSYVHSQLHHIASHHSDFADTPRANFSLLGAVEFRDVVNSLRKENASRTPSPNRSPHQEAASSDYFGFGETPAHGSGHRRRASQTATWSHRSFSNSRKRTISQIIQPGTMASFRMPSGTRKQPERVTSTPAPAPDQPATDDATEESTDTSSPEPNPWQEQSGNPPRTGMLAPSAISQHVTPTKSQGQRRRGTIPPPKSSVHRSNTPSISIMDPTGLVADPILSPPHHTGSPPPFETTSGESKFRIRHHTNLLLRSLFPSLQAFKHKSLFGKVLAIASVPAILALTLTLPVVDDGNPDEGAIALPTDDNDPLDDSFGGHRDGDIESGSYDSGEDDSDGGDRHLRVDIGEELHHLVEGGFSPLRSPLGTVHHTHTHSTLRRMTDDGEYGDYGFGDAEAEELTKELLEEIHQDEALRFSKTLTAAQCVLGPTACAAMIFRADNLPWIALGCAVTGLIPAIIVMIYATDGTSKTWRLARCFAGFVCSMVWIAAIADQVVGVLQALGEILGLSDAIIGLTIFAIGNSMADLVANVTVAQFAPAMAYAACFGGPMLNLLLGIGGSGTYHALFVTPKPVAVHFSPTLWVSATGLIIMLVATGLFVPLNGFMIDRRFAACLVVGYGILMTVNVAVEIKMGRA